MCTSRDHALTNDPQIGLPVSSPGYPVTGSPVKCQHAKAQVKTDYKVIILVVSHIVRARQIWCSAWLGFGFGGMLG